MRWTWAARVDANAQQYRLANVVSNNPQITMSFVVVRVNFWDMCLWRASWRKNTERKQCHVFDFDLGWRCVLGSSCVDCFEVVMM